jgi:hypothetical protein
MLANAPPDELARALAGELDETGMLVGRFNPLLIRGSDSLVLVEGGLTLSCPVSLRQIAPTILHALCLRERLLDAVRLEGTKRLADEDTC